MSYPPPTPPPPSGPGLGGPPGGPPPNNTPQWQPPSSPGGAPLGALIAVIAGGVVVVLVAVVAVVVVSTREPSGPPPVGQDEAPAPQEDGSAALQEIRDEGMVRIGVTESPPFSWSESGEATGSSPEVAREVFAELGVPDHEVVEMADWPSLQAALNVGEVDVVANSAVYDSTACEQFASADPDALHPTTFVVPSGNPEDIESFEDVIEEELTLAVIEGSNFAFHAGEAGISTSDLELVQGTTAPVLDMVADGDVDAFVSSSQWLRWLVEDQDRGDDVELTEPFVLEGSSGEEPMYSGMIFALEDEDILRDVNPVVHEMRTDGRLLEIGEPFGIAEDNLPPEGTIATQACAESGF
ncbi:transporter substrate-binding domain-containing protein [Spiractinospora alimapuensis]|uniref:transporter substrate-binding domain-containing protein n=1 Tax=Spiractinospora alimapuensis TaxID=2820884 RepID=UPI001F23E6AC|nr:transporter substrate-binding domain-containing protein [Spiractinospora alimapuensis]QVQ51503.1 transporter substrate-binding domain-containing protein [Spiractinospora alimapuensis]